MILYVFDVSDGDVFPDHVALVLPDVQAARMHAITLAETIVREQAKTGHANRWYVTIENEKHEQLVTVTSTIVDEP